MVFMYIRSNFIIIWNFSNEHIANILKDFLCRKGIFLLNGCSGSEFATAFSIKILRLLNLGKNKKIIQK